MKLQDLIIIFVMLIATFYIVFYCHAETITIPPEDMKDITISNLQNQVTSQNVVIKMLIKKTGCTIQQDKLVCPDIDEKKEEDTVELKSGDKFTPNPLPNLNKKKSK